MLARTLALSLALVSALPVFAADNNTFDITNRKGVKTATATYSIDKPKDGIKARSTVTYVADGPSATRNYEYRNNKDGAMTSASSQMIDRTFTAYTPSKTRDAININITKASTPAGSRTVSINKPNFMIAFADDTSIWQVLLDSAAGHPADQVYVLYVPAASAKTTDRLEQFRIGEPTPADGTLNGKPVTLKHYTIKFSAGSAQLYTDSDGKLMQAETGPLGNNTHTRTGFVLNKPS